MSEQSTEAPTNESEQAAEKPQEGATEQEPKTFDADYVANLRKEAARYRTEAKKASEALEQQRQASMTEAEKAVAEAEARGRTSATQDFGKKLATAEIRAVAADAKADLTGVFDYLDLTRFVGEDGEPDARAIQAFVNALPKKEATPPSFDGGGRATATGGDDMNKLIRAGLGRG